MKPQVVHCPNCSAPLHVAMGETEVLCEYCASKLRFVPGHAELEVVRTREEMKRRERVDVQKAILEKQLRQEELARWRETAAHVAIKAMPVVGEAVGRAAFRTAVSHAGGAGCGCMSSLLAIGGLLAGLLALL
ncbi:MAG: hypothetical protein KJ067_06400 [Vicinamibacteria bacterium]|nr:hypothetical protein [Vicinamibacteria bacterium]